MRVKAKRTTERAHMRLVDIKELSARLGMAPQTIRNQLSLGTFPLPPRRVGRLLRWPLWEVEEFIRGLPPAF